MLFKELAGVDAFPLCLNTTDVDEIVQHRRGRRADVRRHQPRGHRGAALLRDRAAAEGVARHPGLPRRPARHRGRRAGGAAERAEGRRQATRDDVRVVMVGAGAAGLACAKIILEHGVSDLVVCDIGGILHPDRDGPARRAGARWPRAPTRAASRAPPTTRWRAPTSSSASPPRARSPPTAVRTMADDAIVFAMANPTPEVQPEEVWERRRDHGHGPQRLPEPDQQRAGLPGHLPRRAGRPRARHRRGDEARRGARDRGRDPGGPTSGRSTSSRASSTARSRPRSRTRWPPRRSSPGSPAGRLASTRACPGAHGRACGRRALG